MYSETTSNLGLPYIMPAQAQKHVTHNEALRRLDALTQLSVLARHLSTAPSSAMEGDAYIVGLTASHVWSGHDNEIAVWDGAVWCFTSPQKGWLSFVKDEEAHYLFNGSDWVRYTENLFSHNSATSVLNVRFSQIGLGGAEADDYNVLSMNGPAALFNHNGNGFQAKFNKNGAHETASLLYQSNYSGRAEIGLCGDDDLHVKVSNDGSNFAQSLVISGADSLVKKINTPRISRRMGITQSTIGVLKFDTETVVGSGIHYDIGTGKFTVAHAGTYVISASLFKSATASNLRILIGKNTLNPTGSFSNNIGHNYSNYAGYDDLNLSVMVDLNAGDFVTFFMAEGGLYGHMGDAFNFMHMVKIA